MAADCDSETLLHSLAGDSELRFEVTDTRGSEMEEVSATAKMSGVGSAASLS